MKWNDAATTGIPSSTGPVWVFRASTREVIRCYPTTGTLKALGTQVLPCWEDGMKPRFLLGEGDQWAECVIERPAPPPPVERVYKVAYDLVYTAHAEITAGSPEEAMAKIPSTGLAGPPGPMRLVDVNPIRTNKRVIP